MFGILYVSIDGRHSKILIVRSLARWRARRENFSSTRKFRRRENFGKKSLGRCDRFRQKIVEIGANLAIFEPKYTSKNHTPLFGEFSRSSQDLCESDYDSHKSRDDRLNSPKSGMWIFSSSDLCVSAERHMCVPANIHVSPGLETCVSLQKDMCVLANRH